MTSCLFLSRFPRRWMLGTATSVAVVLSGFMGSTATAQVTNPDVLIDGLGGPAGFGELSQGPNDDGSSSELDLPFTINFFGEEYNTFWINNNGNITFESPLGAFTPEPFPITNQPIIAPYWADVDTRCFDCGEVYVAAPNQDTVVATWNEVGFFSANSSLTNTFQVALRDRSDDFLPGDFDIEFRYGGLNWTTGDASGGFDGFGGTEAQAGFDAGDGVNFFSLPGSFSSDVLDLINLSNLPDPEPGIWSFAVRQGILPGETPDNPLLPVIIDGEFNFDFNVQDPEEQIFIDPEVAVGYNYFLDSGPNITSVELPTDIGDGIYDLWLFNSVLGDFVDSGTDIIGGNPFTFASGGVESFSIRGIEVDAMLDPDDITAFVTGLTFASAGNVSLRQVPLTRQIDNLATVPEPTATLTLLTFGFLGAGASLQRKHKCHTEK